MEVNTQNMYKLMLSFVSLFLTKESHKEVSTPKIFWRMCLKLFYTKQPFQKDNMLLMQK